MILFPLISLEEAGYECVESWRLGSGAHAVERDSSTKCRTLHFLYRSAFGLVLRRTFTLEILLDCVLFNFEILHDRLERLGNFVQPRNDMGWCELSQTEKEHETQDFDLIHIRKSGEDTFCKGGKVELAEACSHKGVHCLVGGLAILQTVVLDDCG